MVSTYTVERTTKIDASPEVIFDRISSFRRWPDWSPWEELDPDMTKTYTGTDGEIGSHYAWDGNRRAGAGSMTITGLDDPRSMTSDLNFTRPFKSSSTMGLTLTPDGQSTTVHWTMTSPHSVITRVMNVFGLMDKQIGKDFEKGLAKLKSLSEA